MAKSLGASGKENLPGRRNSLIAGISIAVSVVIMITAISVSDGFDREIKGKVSGYAGDISVKVPGEELVNSLYPLTIDKSLLNTLENTSGILAVQGIAYITGVMKHENQIEGIVLKGVDDSYNWTFVHNYANEFDSVSDNEIVISSRLASKLNLKLGDRPFLYFIGESVKTRRFTVSAIFDARLEEVDKGMVMCNIEIVRELLGWKQNEYSSLEILLRDRADPAAKSKELQLILNEKIPDDYLDTEVVTSENLFPHLFDWLSLLDYNVFIVLTLMMIVAGFNMISGLLIILFEKISMIGLLKSLGMRDSAIHKIFLARAMSIVIKGVAAGNIIALTLLYIQKWFKIVPLDPVNYFVNHIPVHVNFVKLLLVDIVSITVIAVILFIPARFISKVEPDKTLRQK